MKKLLCFIMPVVMLFCLCGCYTEKAEYTDYNDVQKINDLPEIRFREALVIFPQSAEKDDVTDFYFSWELGIIGCADVEYYMSVKYSEEDYEKEIKRLSGIKGDDTGKGLVYDEDSFPLPAYVGVLGSYSTNAYALTDSENYIIHYVYLCVKQKEDLKYAGSYLPEGYSESGDIKGQSYNVFFNEQ